MFTVMRAAILFSRKGVLNIKYPDFLDKINNAPVSIATLSSGSPGTFNGYAKYTPPTSPSGNMYGSPAALFFTSNSSIPRIVQHAFSSLSTYNHSANNSLLCVMKFEYAGSRGNFLALDRNGYAAESYGGSTGSSLVDFIFYDPVADKMMRWNPHTGSAFVAWDGKFI